MARALIDDLLAQGIVPDTLLRLAVRASLAGSARRWRQLPDREKARRQALFVDQLRQGPIATHTTQANQQHYEIPSRFYEMVLGPWLKYSCCYWDEQEGGLEQAEVAMLKLTCQRAEIKDGMHVLDLGCGWGSLSLWLAAHYPNSRITALSNADSQRRWIEGQASARGLNNLTVIRADVAEVELDQKFDRVLSIEMFEHMTNYERLLAKISRWLHAEGKLFVHHFSHRERAYKFNPEDRRDYMARTYFAGGTMPSHDLLQHFQADLAVEKDWQINGKHYARTLRAWLDRLDQHRDQVDDLFNASERGRSARQWLAYWRNFFIICEETFAFDEGREYLVSHYLLTLA